MGDSLSDSPSASAPSRAERRGRLGPWQRRLFMLGFTLLAALAILGVIELALRIAGFGGYPSTFRDAGTLPDGAHLIVTDHRGPTSYFFENRSLAGSLDPTAFVSPKPANTFRIFVVGESAAKGNPYPRPLSWAEMLRAMLGDLNPSLNIEVINLGTTAVASFPVLGMMTEALDYQPDLVIAYLGNNEYYGAYGVASLHSAGRSPVMIRLVRWTRSLAIAQFIDRKIMPMAKGDPSTTLMETMVGRSHITHDDPARAAATRNLSTFVGEMIQRCRDRGVEIMVCTPPCNEGDLLPLGEPDLRTLSEEQKQTVERLVAQATTTMSANPAAAEETLAQVVAIAPFHATAHYLLGTAQWLQGRQESGAASLRKAVDLDTMPWRPPSSSVQAIISASSREGGVLCDLARAFREASPGGCTGWELMDDHVHASLDGQHLIARTLIRTMEGREGPLRVPIGAADSLPDAATLAGRLGDNPWERYAAAHAMRRLASIGFFKRSNARFFDRWQGFCDAQERAADPVVREQLLLWQDPATHAGGQKPISALVGNALMQAKRYEEAAPLFRFAADSVPPYGAFEIEYRYLNLVCRHFAHRGGPFLDVELARKAIERGRTAMALNKISTGTIEKYVGLLHQLLGEFEQSIAPLEVAADVLRGRNRLAGDEALVEAYRRTGQTSKAVALLESRLAAEHEFADDYRRIRARVLGR